MASVLKFGPNLPRLFGFKNLSSPNDAPLQRISQYSLNFIYNGAPWILSGHAVRLLAGDINSVYMAAINASAYAIYALDVVMPRLL